MAVSQATAQAGVGIRVATGADTITGAVVGSASGAVEIFSGATDSTNAGGTGGASGAISVSTGASTSTLGVSGSTGAISVSTGASDDANSGTITIQTGTAGGTRGVLAINVATISYATAAVQHLLFDNNSASYSIGASGATNMMVFDSRNAAEQVVVNAVNGLGLPNDIPIKAGTLAADVFSLSFVSGSSTGVLSGAAVTAAGALAVTRPLLIETGAATANTAAAGGASGALTIRTGNTDVTNAGGSSGATGQVQILTGNSASTAGTSSSSSGQIAILTGTSADANSGLVSIGTGNALAAGAVLSGNVAITTGTVGGTGTTGTVAITTGVPVGAGVSGNITLTPGTSTGTRGTVTATGFRTASDSNGTINAVRVLTLADSGGVFAVSQAGAYDIDLPSPTSGSGCTYQFVLNGAAANSVTITVLGGAATFIGTITNDVTSVIPATGSTLTFVSGTAAVGDNILITSVAPNLYLVRAVTSTAGGITIA